MAKDLKPQIERRRQRGLTEITKVINRGSHAIFSLFEVSSRSGRTYQVRIRSLAELHNTCNCMDYRTNLIGTCKHIEAVLAYLRKTHGRNLQTLARKQPEAVQIYLHYGETETVRATVQAPIDVGEKKRVEFAL